MTPAKVRLAAAAMGKPKTKIADLCDELGISSQTLYRYVSPTGDLRQDGKSTLGGQGNRRTASTAILAELRALDNDSAEGRSSCTAAAHCCTASNRKTQTLGGGKMIGDA
jgi:transposase-like protein